MKIGQPSLYACDEMEFEYLNLSHALPLLQFEVENRAWFESLIAGRDDDFYSIEGVRQHIEQLLAVVQQSHYCAFVGMKDNKIIARANLKHIDLDTKTAEIGYRVAKASGGKGLGTACVERLVHEARADFNIKLLRAYVLANNPASQRILEKHAFVPRRVHKDFFTVRGVAWDCREYEKTI